MESRFRIVYSGELRPEVRAKDAIRDFALRFRIPEEQARSLILGRKEQIVKRDVDADTAETFRIVLEGIGLEVRVEPMTPPQPGELGLVPRDPLLGVGEPVPGDADEEPPVFFAKGVTPPPPTSSPRPRGEAAATAPPLPRPQPDPVTSPRSSSSAASPPGPPARDEDTLSGPRGRGFTAGWNWLARGFWHFKTDPWPWIGALIILYVVTIAVNLVPIVGVLASTIIGPMLTGGLMVGAQAQQRGEDFRVEHLFAGFGDRAGQLALIGVIYLVGGILIAVVIGVWLAGSLAVTIAGTDMATLGNEDPTQVMRVVGPTMILPVLVALLFAVPLAMALFLAPPLVALDGLTAVAAMRLSFLGCLQNLVPFLLYALLATLLLFLGVLTFLLGLLVVTPVLMASVYAAYRDIYFEPGWR